MARDRPAVKQEMNERSFMYIDYLIVLKYLSDDTRMIVEGE